jgi:hypothetical protein
MFADTETALRIERAEAQLTRDMVGALVGVAARPGCIFAHGRQRVMPAGHALLTAGLTLAQATVPRSARKGRMIG